MASHKVRMQNDLSQAGLAMRLSNVSDLLAMVFQKLLHSDAEQTRSACKKSAEVGQQTFDDVGAWFQKKTVKSVGCAPRGLSACNQFV